MEDKPLVSIICITYNHEKYIREAIEGFLIQKTNFPIEIFIHDDCSTDKTPIIIQEYVDKYKKLIKPIYQSVNQYSLGKKITPIVLPYCKGKYIAMCEGDDYWTDPFKLQKQVDLLEANKIYSACSHHVNVVDSNNEIVRKTMIKRSHVYTQEDIFSLSKRGTYTCSLVFRRECLPNPLPEWFLKVNAADKFLKAMLTEEHKIFVMKDTMACYRRHSAGIWSSMDIEKLKQKMEYDMNWMITIYGNKYPYLLSFVKDRHDLEFIPYYLNKGERKKAWMSFFKILRYPKLYLREPVLMLSRVRLLINNSLIYYLRYFA
jgi:glycosyltransferase involved in cell wall biosynthesis